MNIDRIIASVPGQSAGDRARSRANAVKLLESGTQAQRSAARQLIAAIDEHEAYSAAAHSEHLRGMPIAQRVVAAFRALPLTDNERKTVQALLDHPGSTTTELSRACGHDSMIWQMHFGNLCKARQAYLWPAEKMETRDTLFFSGILAEADAANRFTMKPDVAVAFAKLGLKAAGR